MSGDKALTKLPKTTLGPKNLDKQISNLSLNREALDYLNHLDGELRIIYSPHSTEPRCEITTRRGEPLATLKEFEAIANYKAIIGKKLDENKTDEKKKAETCLYKNAVNAFVTEGGTDVPTRIIEANDQRFKGMTRELEVINKNVEVISTLPTGNVKDYILEKAGLLKKIYIECITSCMGGTQFDKASLPEKLLNNGVPKWLNSKLTDANFSKDAKTTAFPLLFSKGNYMKSISLTTEEIAKEGFLAVNATITEGSHAIIDMAGSALLRSWLLNGIEIDSEDVDGYWNKFQWPMIGSGTANDFLEPRLNRNKVTQFTEAQAPKGKPGKDTFRGETKTQSEVRKLRNRFNRYLSIIMDFVHFVVNTDNSREEFWGAFFDQSNWVISPENHAYVCIDAEANKDGVLNSIRNLRGDLVKEKLHEIIVVQMGIPSNSKRFEALKDIIAHLAANNSTLILQRADQIITARAHLTRVTFEDLKSVSNFVDVHTSEVEAFRGRGTTEVIKKQKEDKSYLQNTTMLSKKTKRALKKVTDDKLRREIMMWIKTNFRNEAVQLLAAERAASAVDDQDLGYRSEEEQDSDSDESE